MPADAAKYWTEVFARLHETATWKKYIADNQLEDHFVPGPQFKAAMDDITKQLRHEFEQAGVKVVR